MLIRRKKQFDEIFPAFAKGAYHDVLLPVMVSDGVDRSEEDRQAKLEEDKRLSGRLDPYAQREAGRIAEEAEKRRLAELAAKPSMPSWKFKKLGKKAVTHRLFNEALIPVAKPNVTSIVKEDRERKRMALLHEFWIALGGTRRIALPVKGWRGDLTALAESMPNFACVVDYLAGEFALAEMSKKPPRLAPMLLGGPPGVGKTTFARKLAGLFKTNFLSISMETAQTATALSGSEQYWGNSKPGQLFELLVEGEFANPVVLIDEVEKARNAHGYDPGAALYGLLEPSSAATWRDLSVPYLKIDASRVMWILTSNKKHLVAQPLLSRMRVFDIAGLTPAQSGTTARRIFKDVVDGLAIDFDTDLSGAIATKMATLSPREMHRVARELVARAALAGRRHVAMSDLVSLISPPSGAGLNTRVSVTVVEVSTQAMPDEAKGATKH